MEYNRKKELLKERAEEIRKMEEKAMREENEDAFGLEYVSTTDLKKELRRRKRWK